METVRSGHLGVGQVGGCSRGTSRCHCLGEGGGGGKGEKGVAAMQDCLQWVNLGSHGITHGRYGREGQLPCCHL